MSNFHTPYENEREGQMEFFDNYAIPYNDDAAILIDNTDGVYNGNIFSRADYEALAGAFGRCPDPVMLGRGLISDPSLADKLRGTSSETDFIKFRQLHDTLYHEYQKVMSPDINILHKMRELWSYWQDAFEGGARDFKRLLKAKKCAEYEEIAERILAD